MAIYFDTSWAILSSIGVANVFYGLILLGIHGSLTFITSIPIVVSTAGAIANGLCYYAWYSEASLSRAAAAYAVADIMWLVQEAGLSMYSYAILVRILQDRELRLFQALFWLMILCITGIRLGIMIFRIRTMLHQSKQLEHLINYLHVGYFVCLALLECISSVFLLLKFAAARKTSKEISSKGAIFSHLMRSTEMRLTLLAIIGVARAVSFSFQPSIIRSEEVTSQIDVFFYSLECLFPTMFFIDILASKLVFTRDSQKEYTLRIYRRDTTHHERLSSIGPSPWKNRRRADGECECDCGKDSMPILPAACPPSESSNKQVDI